MKEMYNEVWIQKRADPYVYKHTDGTYYFTASLPDYDGIALRKADKLFDLKDAPEKMIWKKHDKGIMSFHVWAPELHFIFGKWYIYFAAGDVDDIWAIRPYVLECRGDDPFNDEWIEKGMMQCSDEDPFSFRAFSLDGTVLENHGEYYFIWAEKVGVGKQISNLYIAKMESATKLSTVQVLLTTPDYDWERVGFWVNEGPAFIKNDGKIYMTYSASETGVAYCIGMLSADENDDLLDPKSWEKRRMPVLKTSEELKIYGPGHNSFTVNDEGEPVMIYHARTEAEIVGNPLYNPNRHAMVMKVKWNESGEPEFSYC
ncbi:MAG: family 43 glycosylhydrolase [Lachnospiraceae bacterium]|nr:family 43 glycosylhydrolase [Lachnospiraceae bacterium]MCI6665960.1 family 43 glycosylhydrolase [Lachnospiraceae bacterium]MDY4836484.1 family 43 glycosylhydrolase [Lachnospiraceae bacterium]